MSRASSSIDTMVRRAFDLLLELREQADGRRQLTLAIEFLETLARHADARGAPVVVSVQAFRVRRP